MAPEARERLHGGDAYAPKHWPPQLVHYVNTYGQDKFLFGTDWPVIDPERAVDEIAELNFARSLRRSCATTRCASSISVPDIRLGAARRHWAAHGYRTSLSAQEYNASVLQEQTTVDGRGTPGLQTYPAAIVNSGTIDTHA